MKKNSGFPTFTSSEDWSSYQQLLINRLAYLEKVYKKTQTSLNASIGYSEMDALTIPSYLELLGGWMAAYGVNLEWLLEINNRTYEVRQSGKQWSAKEQMEFPIICERLLNTLLKIRGT
jgi:hypothetical protein